MISEYSQYFNFPIKTDYVALDKSLIKKSNTRLIVSGGFYELYRYSQPYYYNKSPSASEKLYLESVKSDERRDDNLFSCRQHIRRLINSNVGIYGHKTKFVTYTFKENITNLRHANKIWQSYQKKLKYRFKSVKYLLVVEFQKRGAVHYHVVYFNLPYIAGGGKYLSALWGSGDVNIRAIELVKNVGAYVCKYLQKGTLDRRLVGEKAFFCSRGLVKPFELKSKESIDIFLNQCILKEEVKRVYSSTLYGEINYFQGEIKNKQYANQNKS